MIYTIIMSCVYIKSNLSIIVEKKCFYIYLYILSFLVLVYFKYFFHYIMHIFFLSYLVIKRTYML